MPPAKTRSKDNEDNCEVNITEAIKSAFEDESFKIIIKQIVQSEVHSLNKTISTLRDEVKVLQESNKDLIRLLTSGECLNRLEIINQNLQNTNATNWPTLHSTNINSKKKDVYKKKEPAPVIRPTPKKIADKQQSVPNIENVDNNRNGYNNEQNFYAARRTDKRYKQKPKSKIVFGSGSLNSTKSGFSAVVRKTWIYVGRASPGTSEDNMRALLAEKFPKRDFIIEKLPKWKDGTTESFKVGVDIDLVDDIFNSENWPSGTLIKKYKFFRGDE